MSSERRSIEGELPDGQADRAQGYTHNPNPEDEVAAQRARFEEMQRKLQQDRAQVVGTINEVREATVEQYQEAKQDPEHQKFVEEQVQHQLTDPPHLVGGQERDGAPEGLSAMPGNVEISRHAPLPTTPRRAEEFNNEE